jgi:hypothetical protein
MESEQGNPGKFCTMWFNLAELSLEAKLPANPDNHSNGISVAVFKISGISKFSKI